MIQNPNHLRTQQDAVAEAASELAWQLRDAQQTQVDVGHLAMHAGGVEEDITTLPVDAQAHRSRVVWPRTPADEIAELNTAAHTPHSSSSHPRPH